MRLVADNPAVLVVLLCLSLKVVHELLAILGWFLSMSSLLIGYSATLKISS